MSRLPNQLNQPMSFATSACALSVVVLSAFAAHAVDPCETGAAGLPRGPVAATMQHGEFGVARRVCPRTEIAVESRGSAIAEVGTELLESLVGPVPAPVAGALLGKEQFYVNAQSAGTVVLSYALSSRLELFGSFEALRGQYVRASYTATPIGIGHTNVGATVRIFTADDVTLGVTSRLQLPTAISLYKNAWPIELDTGVSMLYQPLPALRWHTYMGGSGSIAITAGASNPRVGLVSVSGLEVLPFDWLSFVVDVNSRTAYDAPLDHLGLAFGARAKIFGGLGVQTGFLFPILGQERGLAAAMVSLSYRLEQFEG